MCASRAQLTKNVIIPELKSGKWVIADRYTDSTIAYQHYGMGVDINLIKKINDYLLKKIKIDFTFLNIVSSKNMKKRLRKRKNLNRYDQFADIFYKRVQNGFIKIFNKNPKKYMKINSNLDRIIKLSSNENPYGPSKKAIKKKILNKINELI